jgi:hypothetical protein
MTTAYPLSWPTGWPRTPAREIKSGKSNWSHKVGEKQKPWTFDAARRVLADELDAIGATDIVLSTNYELRIDGQPKAGSKVPEDKGIAVYFTLKGRPLVMARDAFDRAEDNMRSLSLAIAALRSIERHGGSLMMERAFEGFTALPAPGKGSAWRDVMGIYYGSVSRSDIEREYKRLAKERHPDTGGSEQAMAELNAARDRALEELGA